MSRRSAAYASSSTRSPSPHVSTSGRGERSRSPLSPTRLSRIQEKEELKNLNDRLATYIDTVRRLESENSRLTMQIRTTQETVTREITDVKNVYEKELTDVRRALDGTAKEKAKLQLLVDKLNSENDELGVKLAKREKESSSFEKQLKSSEIHNQDLQRRLNQTLSENRRLENSLKDTQAERDKLIQQLQGVKKDLDNEKLLRVDLENKFQTLKEESLFKDVLHKNEITETRKMKETEVSEIDTQLRENYEQKLADTLRELREQYETQMRMNRDEIETIYETKISDLQNKLERSNDTALNSRDELRSLKSKVESITTRNSNLENQFSSLQNRIKDLEKMLEQERDWHSEALQRKDDELRKLQEDIAKQLTEYQDLLDIKVGLDLEINAYRKLLEGEESRLNMSPVGSRASTPTPSRSTPMRTTKRRRTVLSETERTSSGIRSSGRARGDIEISEQDLDGKFVKILNKGTSEVALGGWQLVQHANNSETKYKFPRAAIIKPKMALSVWSSDSGVAHSPPQNYLMKNQSWISSSSANVMLLNTSGEEVAIRESLRVSESSEIFVEEQ